MLIHRCTSQCKPIPINTYKTYHMYNTSKYLQIPTNTDHCIQYIYIHTNTNNTCQYTWIHIKTDQYLSICTMHTNTYQYWPISAHIKYQYMPMILAIHTNTCNTYRKQYIPLRTTIHTMPIHANTFHNTIHSNTYSEVQYLQIRTNNFTDIISLIRCTIIRWEYIERWLKWSWGSNCWKLRQSP